MGLEKRTGEGKGTTYLRVANGAFWVTKNVDPNHPDYVEETYHLSNGDEGVRKGYKYNTLTGKIQSGFFKSTDYGDIFNLYVEDDDGLYCIGFKVDGNWGAYSIVKRMLIALMFADLDEDVVIGVSTQKKDDGYIATILWVKQFGKSLVLNPYVNEEKIDTEKSMLMPERVKEQLMELPHIQQGEELTKKQKIRRREEELEQLINLVISEYLAEKNEALLKKLSV